MLRFGVAALALMLGLSAGTDVWAQGKKTEKTEKAAKQKTEAPAEKPPMPSGPQMAMLVQTHMTALSQANLTGNYTVLHALGAPSFQKSNPPDKLKETFASIKKIDLTPVILYSPTLTTPPAIDDKNMLRLSGYYQTSPQQVVFDLLFQPVAGQWRLFGISVATRIPQQPTAQAPAAQPTKKK